MLVAWFTCLTPSSPPPSCCPIRGLGGGFVWQRQSLGNQAPLPAAGGLNCGVTCSACRTSASGKAHAGGGAPRTPDGVSSAAASFHSALLTRPCMCLGDIQTRSPNPRPRHPHIYRAPQSRVGVVVVIGARPARLKEGAVASQPASSGGCSWRFRDQAEDVPTRRRVVAPPAGKHALKRVECDAACSLLQSWVWSIDACMAVGGGLV
jgi:hypothetical protein